MIIIEDGKFIIDKDWQDPLVQVNNDKPNWDSLRNNLNLNYILKNESVIIKLYEEFQNYFPEEKKEYWKARWTNENNNLPPIKIEKFRKGNNKHLLLTILHEAHQFMKDVKIEDYAKKRWGLKSYHSNISRYLNSPDATDHPDLDKIIKILKPEQK